MGDMEQAVYYMVLIMSICRRLNVYHGDVYARTSTLYYFMPSTTDVEKQRIVREFARNYPQLDAEASDIALRPRPRVDSPTFSSLLLKESRYPNYHEIERLTLLYVGFMMKLDRSRNASNSPLDARSTYVPAPHTLCVVCRVSCVVCRVSCVVCRVSCVVRG
jgi:hypothetical protein